jgi:hypothetical protein
MSRLWNCLGFGLEKEWFFVRVKVKLPVKNKGLGGDMRLSMMQICKLIFLIKKTEEREKKKKESRQEDTSKSY